MSFFSKTMLAVGTAAMLSAASAPAMADPYHGRHHDDDHTGAIVAGALLLGGIAAIAASSHDHHRDDDRGRDVSVRYSYSNDGYYRDGDYAPPPRHRYYPEHARGYGDGYYRGYDQGYDGRGNWRHEEEDDDD